MNVVHLDMSGNVIEFEQPEGTKKAIPSVKAEKGRTQVEFVAKGWEDEPDISRLTFSNFRVLDEEPDGSYKKGSVVGAASGSLFVERSSKSTSIEWRAPGKRRFVGFSLGVEMTVGGQKRNITVDPVIDDRP